MSMSTKPGVPSSCTPLKSWVMPPVPAGRPGSSLEESPSYTMTALMQSSPLAPAIEADDGEPVPDTKLDDSIGSA